MATFMDAWLERRRAAEKRRAAAARIRGIRGAIDVESDCEDAVRASVSTLIAALERRNALTAEHVISAVFTATPDITCMFPALAARDAGWGDVPLLCATEIAVPGSLRLCIRVLVHVELPPERAIEHVYLGRAAALRPDLSGQLIRGHESSDSERYSGHHRHPSPVPRHGHRRSP